MIWFSIIVAVLVAWLDIIALLALRSDQTLGRGQKFLQALVVIAVPMIGAVAILRLCELAVPGSGRSHLVPWPLKRVIEDRSLHRHANPESFENYKRRFWNM